MNPLKTSIRPIPVVLTLLLAAGCAPTPSPTTWYKGNLHTHSFWSDGDDFPEAVIAWYGDRDYDFIALSDHNTTADTERWIRIDSTRRRVYDDYRTRFDPDMRQRGDTLEVRLRRFDEYRALLERPGDFIVLRGEEISDRFENRPIHVNATNIRHFVAPQGGESVTDVMQRDIDVVLHQRAETGIPMIAHINHPNFGWAISPADLVPLEGEHFFEVYNGHPAVHNEGDDQRPGTEPMWDYVNAERLAAGRALLFGLAVDDAHSYHQTRVGLANPGRGWIMVRADSLTPGSLIRAMENGDFYASSGVTLSNVDFDGRELRLDIAGEEGVSYVTTFVGARRVGTTDSVAVGTVYERADGIHPVYRMSGDELFVRATVVSDKPMANPYREGEPERAWTQPVVPR